MNSLLAKSVAFLLGFISNCHNTRTQFLRTTTICKQKAVAVQSYSRPYIHLQSQSTLGKFKIILKICNSKFTMNSCNICIRLFLCNGLCYFPWKPFMTHTQVDKYLCALTVGFPNSSYMIFPSLHGKQGCVKHLNCYREIGAFSQK